MKKLFTFTFIGLFLISGIILAGDLFGARLYLGGKTTVKEVEVEDPILEQVTKGNTTITRWRNGNTTRDVDKGDITRFTLNDDEKRAIKAANSLPKIRALLARDKDKVIIQLTEITRMHKGVVKKEYYDILYRIEYASGMYEGKPCKIHISLWGVMVDKATGKAGKPSFML